LLWAKVAMGGVLSAALLITAPLRAEVAVSDKARGLFRDGVAMLKDPSGPQYAEAYEAFKAAYADSPSSKILGNLGLCATKLERDGEAIEAYERYLDDAGAKSAKERKQILADLERLKRRSGKLTLTITPADATILDRRLPASGEPVVNNYEVTGGAVTLGLRSGHHRLVIEAPGRKPATVELDVAAAGTAEQEITLESDAAIAAPGAVAEPVMPDNGDALDDSDDGGGFGLGVWVGIGATGALGIATGVVGGLAASNHSSYEEALVAGDDTEAADLRDKGKTLNVVGDVLLGTTIAAAAVTGVFLILVLTDDDGGDAVSATIVPLVGPTTAGLAVGGSF
jgi:hypothetical protein